MKDLSGPLRVVMYATLFSPLLAVLLFVLSPDHFDERGRLLGGLLAGPLVVAILTRGSRAAGGTTPDLQHQVGERDGLPTSWDQATFEPIVLRSPTISIMMLFNHWLVWTGLMAAVMVVTHGLGVPSGVVVWGAFLMAAWFLLLPWYLRANLTLGDEQVTIRNPGRVSEVLHASEISSVDADKMLYAWMQQVTMAVVVFRTHAGDSHRATLPGATKEAKGRQNYLALRDWCARNGIHFDVPVGHLEVHPVLAK